VVGGLFFCFFFKAPEEEEEVRIKHYSEYPTPHTTTTNHYYLVSQVLNRTPDTHRQVAAAVAASTENKVPSQ
jgi:hypothetical protein